jgi:hypothetical protein
MMFIANRLTGTNYDCHSIKAHDAKIASQVRHEMNLVLIVLGIVRKPVAALLVVLCLIGAARAETIDPAVMKALHIGVRPVAQPTLLELVTGTPAILHSRPAAKPLTITDLDKPHTSGLKYVGSGGWSTQ